MISETFTSTYITHTDGIGRDPQQAVCHWETRKLRLCTKQTQHNSHFVQMVKRKLKLRKLKPRKQTKKLFALEKCSIIIGLELRHFLLSSCWEGRGKIGVFAGTFHQWAHDSKCDKTNTGSTFKSCLCLRICSYKLDNTF